MNFDLEIITGEGLKQIQGKQRIGSGVFRDIYTAKWRGLRVAIKELKPSDFTKNSLEDLQRECQMMARFRCKYLVDLYAFTQEPYGLMMECMEGGSLCKLLQTHKEDIPWIQRYRWAKEVGKAIEFLHAAGVFHRDIKSENVFLTKTGQAKLGNLGLAQFANTMKSTQGMPVGSYAWIAPELWEKNAKYTEKSDVYSYGVVLWEIASRKQPYNDIEKPNLVPRQRLMGKVKLEISNDTPMDYRDIIKSCFDVNPDNRPTIQEVVSQLTRILKAEKEKKARELIAVPYKLSTPMIVTEKTKQAKLAEAKGTEAPKNERFKSPISKEAAQAEQLKFELVKSLGKKITEYESGKRSRQQNVGSSPTKRVKKEATIQVERVEEGRSDRIEPFFFDEEKWKRTLGDPGPVPPLPANINEILSSACPFWTGKRVWETHLLVLIPETVDGQPLTLNRLGKLIEHPVQGYATKYKSIDDMIVNKYGDQRSGGSYWVLMTRDVVDGTRDKTFNEEQDLVKRLGKGLYQVPTLIEAAACILVEHAISGSRLYSNSPWTYTICQETIEGSQTVVGGFSPGGVYVTYYFHVPSAVGAACLRKF